MGVIEGYLLCGFLNLKGNLVPKLKAVGAVFESQFCCGIY